ncbi:DUF2254 domain-containing protein [Jannaschia sp. W003]|uniref:DUF2254 domain-containing protein n=1 Tax=Jannaschia sp. W003 TaxID=2867012 RepID=UPI0021A93970|nr:DUF2254 domain-containing protein [Jannaschia sp. W003]UWQ22453.1 DUF2254 domain-containing protein [Jannaschia sp. W003]
MHEPGALARKVLQEIRGGYWFIPGTLAAGAAALALALWWFQPEVIGWLPVGELTDDAARNLLTVIASSIIGVTGVMFSLTLVAVTHAAGKYGPRLIGNFMRDRGNQWALGILVATFVYAFTALVLADSSPDSVIQLTVLVALGLTFLSVGTMIFYVHHVPETVNVSNITAGLGERLTEQLRARIDRTEEARASDGGANGSMPLPERDPDLALAASGRGYIQTVAYDRLAELARRRGAVMRIEARAGEFVHPRRTLLRIWGEMTEDEAREALDRAVALGPEPTETQTPTFLADQLVEMIGIALSPGVNDPFTAVNCINWLAAALAEALVHRGGLRQPPSGRLHGDWLDFAALYARTFPAAMPYLTDDRMATEAAIRALEELMTLPATIDRRALLADLRLLRRAHAKT